MLENIRGNEKIKAYFERAFKEKRLSHSYLFEGSTGIGKKTMAMAWANLLLCENSQANKPCGVCKSCELLKAGNHPDLIMIEKDAKTTKIDAIREKLVLEMETKPYRSAYKIVIVKDADSLTPEAQNAMLKTMEEPPSYGMIILMTQNAEFLLPTIRSRCVQLRFEPLKEQELYDCLESTYLPAIKKRIYVSFCDGKLGVLKQLLHDESFLERREKSVQYLLRLEKVDLMAMYELIKEITEEKENLAEILEFWELWYRDLAVLKTTGQDNLYYLDYKEQLLDSASKLTYNKISTSLLALRDAKLQVYQNVYTTFIIENLLLNLKERKK